MRKVTKVLFMTAGLSTLLIIVACAALGGGGMSTAQQQALQAQVDSTKTQLDIEKARTANAIEAAQASGNQTRIASAHHAQDLETQLQTMLNQGQTEVNISRGPDNVVAITGAATGVAAIVPVLAPYLAVLGIGAGVLQTIRKSLGDNKAGSIITNLGGLLSQVAQANTDAEVVSALATAKPESAQAVLDAGGTPTAPAIHTALSQVANKS